MAIDKKYKDDDENKQLMEYRDTCVVDDDIKINMIHLANVFAALL